MLIDIGHYLEINKILVSLFLGGRVIGLLLPSFKNL